MRAFRHRDFRLFWTGALISNTGTWLANVTVPYVLYQLTRSELWVGMATFAQFMPGVLFGPTGGSLADRFDRRKLLIITQSLMGLAALALWLTWTSGLQSPGMILALVAAQRDAGRPEHPQLAGVRARARSPGRPLVGDHPELAAVQRRSGARARRRPAWCWPPWARAPPS